MGTEDDLEFLKVFPKNANDMYVVYDRFTFDDLFRSLLANGYYHEDAMYFMLANCSMSAIVFQERLHNRKYRKLKAEDTLPSNEADWKRKVINDFIEVARACD
ncbi:MAG: hypothetical protein HY809_01625 [Nitrospirae bacterium]|nr:hypothetical protein [Nitrospirota bacterium]